MDYTLLENAGIDVQSLINRLMGNEALITRFMQKFIDDDSFEKLSAAICDENYEAALAASHTLKGMCGNLSITKLFDLFTKQVELIRAGKNTEAVGLMPEITQTYKTVTSAISEWLAQ